jgi:hypothetical protein
VLEETKGLQAGAWTTMGGGGTQPGRNPTTSTPKTSRGEALPGKSTGTGPGEGGLALAGHALPTGGAHGLTGMKNALVCGAPRAPCGRGGQTGRRQVKSEPVKTCPEDPRSRRGGQA